MNSLIEKIKRSYAISSLKIVLLALVAVFAMCISTFSVAKDKDEPVSIDFIAKEKTFVKTDAFVPKNYRYKEGLEILITKKDGAWYAIFQLCEKCKKETAKIDENTQLRVFKGANSRQLHLDKLRSGEKFYGGIGYLHKSNKALIELDKYL